MSPIDITLRFRHPQEVAALLEIVNYAVEDAEECYGDNGDPADAITLGDYKELQEALWACLAQQGFEIRYDREAKDNKLFYQGEELTYKREPNVAPVLKEDTCVDSSQST